MNIFKRLKVNKEGINLPTNFQNPGYITSSSGSKIHGITVPIGCDITFCKDCDKQNKAIEIAALFEWPCSLTSALAFDDDTQEILLVEERIMHAIQMINPAQQTRRLRFITEEEWLALSKS